MEPHKIDSSAIQHTRAAAFYCWEWQPSSGRVSSRGDVAGQGPLPSTLTELLEWFPPEGREELQATLRQVAEESRPLSLECPAAKGGSLLVRAARGAEDLVYGFVSDLSAQQACVLVQTRDAERAKADFDAFAYAVSHDLRAPLRAIGGFSEVLLESEPGTLEATARQYLPRIVAATRRMSQLLDDLLQLSRFNRAELHAGPVDLAPIAQEVAARLNAGTDRTVAFSAPPSAPVWGDRKLLEASLERLLDNAWKFSRQGESPRVEFGCSEDASGTLCYVRDNGVGFDPEQSGRLFQPLQRLHRASEFGGSGVSLTIVKRIVERHGGSVWAEGALDQGASFWFRLPHAPENF